MGHIKTLSLVFIIIIIMDDIILGDLVIYDFTKIKDRITVSYFFNVYTLDVGDIKNQVRIIVFYQVIYDFFVCFVDFLFYFYFYCENYVVRIKRENCILFVFEHYLTLFGFAVFCKIERFFFDLFLTNFFFLYLIF